jgi:hypothetical protein
MENFVNMTSHVQPRGGEEVRQRLGAILGSMSEWVVLWVTAASGPWAREAPV